MFMMGVTLLIILILVSFFKELCLWIEIQALVKKLLCCPASIYNDPGENNSVNDQLKGFTDQDSLLSVIFNQRKGLLIPFQYETSFISETFVSENPTVYSSAKI